MPPCRRLRYYGMQEGRTMSQKHKSKHRSMVRSDGDNGAFLSTQQATEAVEKLRSGIDQASRAIHDLTQIGGHWAQDLQERSRDMAKDLRDQSGRAFGTVSQQVEHYPLLSLGVAFAVGFISASMMIRR
jgi:ElaB/YqjD/DUF883 family membrane-anchored ribosome-binding protein